MVKHSAHISHIAEIQCVRRREAAEILRKHELPAVIMQFHRTPLTHIQQLRAISYNPIRIRARIVPEAKALNRATDRDGALPTRSIRMSNLCLIVASNCALTVIAPVDSEVVTST